MMKEPECQPNIMFLSKSNLYISILLPILSRELPFIVKNNQDLRLVRLLKLSNQD
jgi:hypothetical protein